MALMNELTPTGRLRVGLVFAPQRTVFFVEKDAAGGAQGVTAELGAALGRELGVPVEFLFFPNSGQATDAVESGAVDVSFMPMDDERRSRIAFGPVYTLIESTYMATGASGARTVAEVDRAGMRVIGVANTTTIRAAARTLKNTTIAPVTGLSDALAALRDGTADAFALSRDSLPVIVAQIPGSRIVDGGFQNTGIGIATGKGKPAALATLASFLERAKASGLVRKAFDAAGFPDQPVAPPVP